MDGNGRWARARGLPRTAGHAQGVLIFANVAALTGPHYKWTETLTLDGFMTQSNRHRVSNLAAFNNAITVTGERVPWVP